MRKKFNTFGKIAETFRDMEKKKENLLMLLSGAFVGLVNGIFGGGGGMLVVPLLVALMKKNPKVAHATAIAVILPISLVSGILYVVFGNFDIRVGIPVTAGVLAGGIIGAFLLKKLPPKGVVVIFAVVMAAAGVKMLFF